MSSTTDGRGERGQILVLFVGGLFVILVIAALAFDVGLMLVERRDQQNAADAAALAGARYVAAAPADLTAKAKAESAARAVAVTNGFDDADPNQDVTVNIPPTSGTFAGFDGFIEVVVSSNRASVFGGIIGVGGWDVAARAVAANQQGLSLPFGMLALKTECKAIHISGNGTVYSASNIQSNSPCTLAEGGGGLSRTGQGTLIVDTPSAICRTAGDIQDEGSGGPMVCTKDPGSFAMPDPLKILPAPVPPGTPAPPRQIATTPTRAIPEGCPGTTDAKGPATDADPRKGCRIAGPPYNGSVWELSPGYYPGGISLEASVAIRMLPGVYYLAGGGFNMTSGASLITIGAPDSSAVGGGVMFYNTSGPKSAAGKITMTGQGAVVSVKPLDDPDPTSNYYPYNGIVIFQDRAIDINGDDVSITGGGTGDPALEVRGLIYVPAGDVKVTGSGGTMTMDQIIAGTFKISGDGNFNVLREYGIDARISGVGLVE